jgi:hypothetical protein
MPTRPEIRLLKGFCSLDFGQQPADAEAIFGPAEETQSLTDDILDTASYVMHYWSRGFSLFFDENRKNSFHMVEVDNPETIMFGVPVFSLQEGEIVGLLREHNFKLSDTERHEWGEKRLGFDEACLDCYFENGRLTTISFSMLDHSEDFKIFPN